MEGKLIIFSAPSGSGKSTIINYLLQKGYEFGFSTSATSRAPRGEEVNGIEYWFLSPEEFRLCIENGDFIEYEEVYPNCFYGTLKREIDSKLERGLNILCDLDVVGGVNMKKYYGDRSLSIFVQPPSIEALQERLVCRQTDTDEMIEKRVAKAAWELEFASQFDVIIINDDLKAAQEMCEKEIRQFLEIPL